MEHLQAAAAPVQANAGRPGRQFEVELPDRIPARCIRSSSATYQINPLLMIAVLKVESNGRTGVVARNTNGTDDLGPSQFNTDSWAKVLIEKYKIPREALVHDMCQSVRALGFALRTEINAAGGDLWKGLGNYHSRTPKHHDKYVNLVYGAYKQMITKGKF
ncbi:lytic transglycosylase domain-containing protein [Massilia orientalis]|uniref:Lytic transglycosylase domain-containing protein n=1 Tax=Massilia orientalis TaxID=3050128 RepID=A0ACC7MEG4_9BURK|nr:lytic transglycosylase domain-containing protein [Massilia sp. YIM B02787]